MSDTNNRSTLPTDGAVPGRDLHGHFAPGNKLGRGNPLAGRAAKIRATLLDVLTPDEARAIAEVIIEKARSGDLAAARELFDRTIGKPSPSDLQERVERLETLLEGMGQ